MLFLSLTYMSNFICQSDVIYYSIHKLIFLCIILYYENLKFKYLINDIINNIWFNGNFASTKAITRKCNILVNSLKFTLNKKILSGIIAKIYLAKYYEVK